MRERKRLRSLLVEEVAAYVTGRLQHNEGMLQSASVTVLPPFLRARQKVPCSR